MRLRRRFGLSANNVLATVALFVALGGTAYAAKKVTGKNIKNNAVTSKHIKNRTIRSKDLGKGLIGSAKARPLNSVAFEAVRAAGPAGVAPNDTDYTTVATLGGIAPGAYVIFSKTDIHSDQIDRVRCRLQAESSVDEANRGLRSNGTQEALNLQLAHTFAGAGSATLSCRTSDGNWNASDTKIAAIKVDSEQIIAG
jgi:hypothetical protein